MAKRGRPCGFDREQALRRALDVFWEAGYEGVTMAALKEAMGGICAPSMYAAYGSKEALFRSAVELYLSQECQLSKGAFALPTARESIAALLESAAVSYTTEGKPRGCLVDLSTTNFSPANKGVEDYLRDHRRRAAPAARAFRTRRGRRRRAGRSRSRRAHQFLQQRAPGPVDPGPRRRQPPAVAGHRPLRDGGLGFPAGGRGRLTPQRALTGKSPWILRGQKL